MNLTLSQDERVIKSWDYGVLKGWFLTHGTFSLAVTNKRVIYTYVSKKETIREDYNLQEIKSVSAAYKYKRRFIFFKRGCLELSFTTEMFDAITVVGLNAISSKPSLLARLPLIGFLFQEKKSKAKVHINEARDIVENISSLIMNTAKAGE